MKQHDFFKVINWDKLYKKEMEPPLHLSMDEDDAGEKVEKEAEDPEEESFLNFKKEEEEAAAAKEEGFEDTDYSEKNAKFNRLKQFTFIKEQRPGQ